MTFETELIKRVAQYKFLYDTRSGLHKDAVIRHETWLKIASELGVEVEQCRQRWKSLRDRFVREHKKFLQGSVNAEELREWEYYDQILFIKDYMKPPRFSYSQKLKTPYDSFFDDASMSKTRHSSDGSETNDRTISSNAPMRKLNDPDLSNSDAGNNPIGESPAAGGTRTTRPQLIFLDCSAKDPTTLSNLKSEAQTRSAENSSFRSDASSCSEENAITPPPRKKLKSDDTDPFVVAPGGTKRLRKKRQSADKPEETENWLLMKMIAKKLDMLPLLSQVNLQIEILTMVNNEVKKQIPNMK